MKIAANLALVVELLELVSAEVADKSVNQNHNKVVGLTNVLLQAATMKISVALSGLWMVNADLTQHGWPVIAVSAVDSVFHKTTCMEVSKKLKKFHKNSCLKN